MNVLSSLYIALGLFGLGVTIVDLFGVFGHHDGGGDHAAAQGGAHAIDHDGGAHETTGGHDVAAAHVAPGAPAHHDGDNRESVLGSAPDRTRVVGRLISGLRLFVSFCLGAGLTGSVALFGHIASGKSLVWSAIGGVLVALITRVVRRLTRRELDSSLRPADFILSEAEITIGVAPRMLGKARVRKFGFESDVYVRCTDPEQSLEVGSRVRIVDFSDECYFVEPL